MLVLLLAFIVDLGSGGVRQRCDLLELNHVTDACGTYQFSQVIVWNWKPEVCRHHVDAWWFVKPESLALLPYQQNGGWVIQRFDSEGNRSTVVARVYRERTTVGDPEREDKTFWHESRRRFP